MGCGPVVPSRDQTKNAARITTTSNAPTTHSADAEKLNSLMSLTFPFHSKLDGWTPTKV